MGLVVVMVVMVVSLAVFWDCVWLLCVGLWVGPLSVDGRIGTRAGGEEEASTVQQRAPNH